MAWPLLGVTVIRQCGYNDKADVWSVGCTVVEMATGASGPWSELSNKLATMYQVGSLGRHPPIPEHLSEGCKRFLARCFVKSACDRASAAELSSDPWLVAAGASGSC